MFVQRSALSFALITLSFSVFYANSDIDLKNNKLSSLSGHHDKYTDNLSANAKDDNYNSGVTTSTTGSSSEKPTIAATSEKSETAPHIIFILADDLVS